MSKHNDSSSDTDANEFSYCVKCEQPTTIVLVGMSRSGKISKEYGCLNCSYTRKK